MLILYHKYILLVLNPIVHDKVSSVKYRTQTKRAMHLPHMSIDPFSSGERLQTLPTYMCLASCARHMMTSFNLLNRNIARRTLLHIMLPDPFLEQIILHLVRTLHLIVRFPMTPRADTTQTHRTLQRPFLQRTPVDLGAVWRQAVMVLLRSRTDIAQEGCSNHFFKLCPRQHLLRRSNRNLRPTPTFSPEAL